MIDNEPDVPEITEEQEDEILAQVAEGMGTSGPIIPWAQVKAENGL